MEEDDSRKKERETKQILRQVQEHLFHAHLSLGAEHESVGMVEVLHHPTNSLGTLNYATPRRNTAWVSRGMIEPGLERLRQLDRTPRVQYVEGLYPPMFAKELRTLDLKLERETPMMVYRPGGINGVRPPAPNVSDAPDGVTIQQATDQRGIELWWYVWRNAYYDVLTLGVEPLFVGRDMAALKSGQQIDILAYRQGFPVGVARVSIHDQTAHILALALMKEARTPQMTKLLQAAANGLIRVIGDGSNRWPSVYDRDLAELYVRLTAHPDAEGVFHATDHADERVDDIVEAIARHARTVPDVRHVPLTETRAKVGPYSDAVALDQVVRSSRARALGWSPSLHSITGNVARLLEEFRSAQAAA